MYRLVKLHVGVILAEIPPYFDRERVGEGAKPLVLVCMVSKTMCGYDRCVAPSAQLQVNRQYLRDVDFESVALRESIAENSLNVHHQPEQSEGCGDGEKELRAFIFTRFMPILPRVIYRVI